MPLFLGTPLSEVSRASVSEAEQTFQVKTGTQLVIERPNGDDILILRESDKGALLPGHVAIGSGAALGSTSVLQVVETLAENFQYGQEITFEVDTTDFGFVTGSRLYAYVPPGNNAQGVTLLGLNFIAGYQGSGSNGFVYGIQGTVGQDAGDTDEVASGYFLATMSAGTADRIVGIISDVTGISGGTVTDLIGIEVYSVQGGSNNYAIKTGLGLVHIGGDLKVVGKFGAYNTSPQAKQTVTGSRGGNAALASLLTALATIGLITNSSTA